LITLDPNVSHEVLDESKKEKEKGIETSKVQIHLRSVITSQLELDYHTRINNLMSNLFISLTKVSTISYQGQAAIIIQ